MPQVKVCTKCGKEYPETTEYFYWLSRTNSFTARCKKCTIEYSKIYTQKHKDKIKKYKKEYHKANKEKIIKKVNVWVKENPEKRKANARAWARKDRKENKNKRNKYLSEWRKEKRISDKKYALTSNMRTAIWQTIKGFKRGRKWQVLVGYSINDLMKHIEKQFQPGMTWDNYGEWHIDHRIPIAVFNFTKPEHEDFKRCWLLRNLQPMWGRDNESKGASLKKPFQPSLML